MSRSFVFYPHERHAADRTIPWRVRDDCRVHNAGVLVLGGKRRDGAENEGEENQMFAHRSEQREPHRNSGGAPLLSLRDYFAQQPMPMPQHGPPQQLFADCEVALAVATKAMAARAINRYFIHILLLGFLPKLSAN